MSRQTLDVIPKHRLLRRTLYGLLLAAPLLPVGLACGNDEGCGFGSTTLSGGTVPLNPDGTAPAQPSCGGCPEQPDPIPLLSCTARKSETPGRADVTCSYMTCMNDGRRPEGLREALASRSGDALGALFAHAAWLEAASVPAFLRLADELKAHGAPESLVRAARRSAGDEVRHTRAMQALARRHGATMPDVDLPPFESRSLEEMLLENAVEGCVRETFGAFVAGWQSRTAQDPEVRGTLRTIARDEVRHAELAWAVEAWAQEQLTPAQRERLLQARQDALRMLGEEVEGQRLPEQLIREAGMPSRDQARTLFQGLSTLVA
ncbi:ferritin-like domain-containing protein [Corallococcus llansteffanensis]|uniref:ferritin-like domain-containing protein n=1 Tax=Corallococcus llansteffanensis TaxID=2316731 RepID=UPI0011C3CC5D|nr:ferritin-like domain-containing protein [Corallococcus llansteffanensis]